MRNILPNPLGGVQTVWLRCQLQGWLEVFSNAFQHEKDSATGGGPFGPKQPRDIAITAPIFEKSRCWDWSSGCLSCFFLSYINYTNMHPFRYVGSAVPRRGPRMLGSPMSTWATMHPGAASQTLYGMCARPLQIWCLGFDKKTLKESGAQKSTHIYI